MKVSDPLPERDLSTRSLEGKGVTRFVGDFYMYIGENERDGSSDKSVFKSPVLSFLHWIRLDSLSFV